MDLKLKEDFLVRWRKYFNSPELPIISYYTDESGRAELVKPGSVPRCIIGALVKVRAGASYCFGTESIGCFGGRKYAGFTTTLMPDFEFFLSCGIPGKLKGERYKKSPELVKEVMMRAPTFTAPARFVVFKRWDKLEAADDPRVVVFFASPDVLAGLFTLASYDEAENMIYCPFGSGCSSIIQYPYLEAASDHPRAIVGMFDPSARPYVPENRLSFAVPISKFARMVSNMDESFLTTEDWQKIQQRIRAEN